MANANAWLAADGQTVTGADLRAITTDLLDTRPGLFLAGDLTVSQRAAGANMSVDVSAGTVAIPGTSPATFDLTVAKFTTDPNNLAIAAADPTNVRDDFIAVKAHTDGTTPELVVLTGTPGAGDPTLLDNHYVLARVNVGISDTSIIDAEIDDLRNTTSSPDLAVNQGQLAAARGGNVVCTSTTRPTANLYDGLHIFETDTGRTYVRLSAAWVYRLSGLAEENNILKKSVAANRDATSATMANWLTGTGEFADVTAPPWAVAAIVNWDIHNVKEITSASTYVIRCSLMDSTGSSAVAPGLSRGVDRATLSDGFTVSGTDDYGSVVGGTDYRFYMRAQQLTGTGALRASSSSDVSMRILWLPARSVQV